MRYLTLTYLFEQLPNVDTGDQAAIDRLLPWSDTLPEECRMPQENITLSSS